MADIEWLLEQIDLSPEGAEIGAFFDFDGTIIDGFGPNGVAARVLDVTARVVRLQTGYVYHYAFTMVIGVAALITWTMFAGGQ